MSGAVCLTVDNLAAAMYVGQGKTNRPDPDEPGLKIGLPRLLSLFADLDVRATFFVEGWNGIHHPDAIEAILDGGHEVGLHGWVHEDWASLSSDRQEALLWDGTAALRSAGADPKGFRAPGGVAAESTPKFLRDLDYVYDSSVESLSTVPTAVRRLDNGIVNVPWTVDMIDGWVYGLQDEAKGTPAQLAAEWGAKLDHAAGNGDVITLIVHPRISFIIEERIQALRDVLMRALDSPDLDVVTAGHVAEHHPS